MSVTLDDLKNQLRIDGTDDDKSLQLYLDAAQAFTHNAVSSDSEDAAFFTDSAISELADLATISYAMEMWSHRSDTMPPTTATFSMVGQLRGLYNSWLENKESES